MKNPRSWHWGNRQQTVYDLAEKPDSSLDLIEKNLGENDLVYELTEIDRRERHEPWLDLDTLQALSSQNSSPQAASNRLSHDHVIKEVDLQNSCTGYDSLGDLQIRFGRTRVPRYAASCISGALCRTPFYTAWRTELPGARRSSMRHKKDLLAAAVPYDRYRVRTSIGHVGNRAF